MHQLKFIALNIFVTAAIFFGLISLFKATHRPESSPLLTKEETHLLSENLGHLLADTLHEYTSHYDLPIVIRTLQRIEQKKEPLKAPNKCQIALLEIESKLLEAETQRNLSQAEAFLAQLATQHTTLEKHNGRLYVQVLKEGSGPALTQDSAPLLHFTETNIEDKVIRDTREANAPIRLKLAETIKGFCQGVEGMQVGERRKIYVHPDLAYGNLSRQQLAIFDVEVIEE